MMYLRTKMQKIRYRLVYNRKKVLNAQGCALVQVEAKLNQRNIYLTTNIYIQPDNWDKSNSQVINHPQATELNAMLFEFVIHLQSIELGFWKEGYSQHWRYYGMRSRKNRHRLLHSQCLPNLLYLQLIKDQVQKKI